MKKLSLVFGALLVVASLSATSFAHYFYRSYQYENLAVRPHTERIAPLNYYRQFYQDYYRCGYRGCTKEVKATIPRTPAGAYLRRETRTNDPSQMTRRANTYQERYLIVQKGDYVDRLGYDPSERNLRNPGQVYDIADTSDYTLVDPRGFVRTSNGDYRANGTSLAYRVLGLDSSLCNANNFWNCAQSHNQAFRSSDAFSFVRNVETSYRWNQTNMDNFNYFPTITESFDAKVNGKNYTYYTYTALNPGDNTMIRIEAVSQSVEKSTAAVRAYKLFETFRFQ